MKSRCCNCFFWEIDGLLTLTYLPDNPNAFRAAAIGYLKVLSAMDEFVLSSKDTRLAWVGVAVALRLTSVRDLSTANIAQQVGVTAASVRYAAAEFAKMADLDSDGGLQFIGNGRIER